MIEFAQRIVAYVPRPVIYWCVHRAMKELLDRKVIPETVAADITSLVYAWSQERVSQ